MAELWVQEQAKLAKMQKEQVGERSPVGNSVALGFNQGKEVGGATARHG
jgi:hypothetical protein